MTKKKKPLKRKEESSVWLTAFSAALTGLTQKGEDKPQAAIVKDAILFADLTIEQLKEV